MKSQNNVLKKHEASFREEREYDDVLRQLMWRKIESPVHIETKL